MEHGDPYGLHGWVETVRSLDGGILEPRAGSKACRPELERSCTGGVVFRRIFDIGRLCWWAEGGPFPNA